MEENAAPDAQKSDNYRQNPTRKIRGVDASKYAEYMHKIERGETTEAALVRKKLLLPGKGIGLKRDDKIFHFRSKVRGQKKPGLCLIPNCNNAPSRRGQCNTHRVYAKRMARLGKATEANLIKRGLLLPREIQPTLSAPKIKKKILPQKHQLKRFTGRYCLFPNCNQKRKTRGLCEKHHRIYLRKKSKLDPKKRKLLEQDLIRRRLLLPLFEENKDATAFELGSKIRGTIRRI